jgi:r-opsin
MMFTYVNKYFFVSLTVSDLLFGILVIPFSSITSVFKNWVFGETFCHIEAYLAAILWIVSLYSLMWLSIDFYMSLRKGDRYESVMSPMKAKCWIAFVWIAATFYCCPPLFGVGRARYYPEAFFCIVDWKLQRAYLMTSGLLIIIPPLISLIISNCYIFTKKFKEKSVYWEKVSEYNSRPNAYVRNFVVSIVYILSWLPWCSVMLHEVIHKEEAEVTLLADAVHFFTIWFAMGNCAWKFLVYLLLDGDFRKGLCTLYKIVPCGRYTR